MGPHQLRNGACRLAPIDWAKAATYAEHIEKPWYACQSLAWLGRYSPPPISEQFIDRAFRKAEAGKDAYQHLAAAAWPLRALVELGQIEQAEQAFDRISGQAAGVTPPSSRSEACLLVYQAIVVANEQTGLRALRWLLSASQPTEHWRQERAVCDAIVIAISIGLVDRNHALTLVHDEKQRTQIIRRLDRGEVSHPRSFFWEEGLSDHLP